MSPELSIQEIAEKIYRDHYPELLLRAMNETKDIELARDAVMNVFRSFIKNEWKINVDKRRSYFLVAVTREAVDVVMSYKKRLRREIFGIHLENDIGDNPLPDRSKIDMEDRIQLVRELINKATTIPEKQKHILLLTIQGLNNQEIAEELNMKLYSVANIQWRAIKALKNIIAGGNLNNFINEQ